MRGENTLTQTPRLEQRKAQQHRIANTAVETAGHGNAWASMLYCRKPAE